MRYLVEKFGVATAEYRPQLKRAIQLAFDNDQLRVARYLASVAGLIISMDVP